MKILDEQLHDHLWEPIYRQGCKQIDLELEDKFSFKSIIFISNILDRSLMFMVRQPLEEQLLSALNGNN